MLAAIQEWFAKGGCPFVGVIVNPYNQLSPMEPSQITCLTVGSDDSRLSPPHTDIGESTSGSAAHSKLVGTSNSETREKTKLCVDGYLCL